MTSNNSHASISLGSLVLPGLLIAAAIITHDMMWIYIGLAVIAIQVILVIFVMLAIFIYAWRKTKHG